MKHLTVDVSGTLRFADKIPTNKYYTESEKIIKEILASSDRPGKYTGWADATNLNNKELLADIEQRVSQLRKRTELLVVIGIGGSYLGAKAVISALTDSFGTCGKQAGNVLFAGNSLSEKYLSDMLSFLSDKSFALCVISKSGTTTEPAIAFRVLKKMLEEREGKEEARERTIVITDKEKGALCNLAQKEGYKKYIIPENTGGRYSVLTPVGLFPAAYAGIDIRQLLKGAEDMQKELNSLPAENNPAIVYANARNILLESNYITEILANFEPSLHYVSEWWRQLFGESEGKEGKGIFPASVNYTTDLHSMGQYVQEGRRDIFETVLSVEEMVGKTTVPYDDDNGDNLNYLAGKHLDEINKKAQEGTLKAHIEGGVPNISINIPELNEYYLGELFYFFEMACAVSGTILGVNPFDQPGVEAYKTNMFRLLEKPGYK